MTKTAINYLLCFLLGCVLTLSAVLGLEPSISSGGIGSVNLSGFLSVLSPTSIAIAILVMSAVALLTLYWKDAAALAGHIRRPVALPGPRPATPAAEQPSRGQSDVNTVREELERQLGRLIVLIAGHIENSKDHVASLKSTNAHLASVTSVSELRDVVQSLIAANQANEHQTHDLEMRLKEAQDQASMLRQRLTQAEKLAALDPLTSVANRRRFEQFFASTVDDSHHSGTPLCLILTDIDRFKDVNDTHGHAAGDKVLKAFADLLSKNVRPTDLVARYGGEEFALVLPKTPMGDAFGIAERIRKEFALHGGPDTAVSAEFGRLTASFGIAQIREGEPPSALIQRADQMLYEAKEKGRNRTMIWSSSSDIPPA